MKRTNHNHHSGKVIPFRPVLGFCPNARSKRYYIDKLVDWALAAVTSLGAVTALFFLIML